MAIGVPQALLLIALPAGVMALCRHVRGAAVIGPVVLCYAVGLVLGNLPGHFLVEAVSLNVAHISVALAIPLLLFSLNVIAWLRLARTTLLSFLLCIVSVLVVSAAAASIFADRVPNAGQVAGMLVGVYTGGTPNMAAIGTALGVDAATFVLVNAADVLVGAVYLLFLLTVAGRILAHVLPPTPRNAGSDSETESLSEPSTASMSQRALGILLALAVIGIAAAVSLLVPKSAQMVVAILGITSFAIGASLVQRVRAIPGTASSGNYLLLVFCVAIGATADFATLVESSGMLLLYAAVVVIGSVVLHVALARLFRIDRDTVLITSTAAIFGPAFVAPVAEALGNREVILSGLTTGLLGYAVGNYFGVGVAWLLT